MKKPIFLFLIACGVFTSCSNNSEEFELAAKEFCNCMSEGEVDAEDAAAANVNLGICLLDSKIDLKASEMSEEIEKQCPEYKEGFKDFVKELN